MNFRLHCIVPALVVLPAMPTNSAARCSGLFGVETTIDVTGSVGHSALALVTHQASRFEVLAGGSRFHDRQLGSGTGVIIGGAFTVAEPLRLRVSVVRHLGDEDFRSLRLKLGPEWRLSNGTVASLSYVRDDSNLDDVSHAALAEGAVPLGGAWSGTIAAGGAHVEGGRSTFLGTAGIVWTPWRHLALTAEGSLSGWPSAMGSGPPTPTHPSRLPILGEEFGEEPGDRESLTAWTTRFALRIPL